MAFARLSPPPAGAPGRIVGAAADAAALAAPAAAATLEVSNRTGTVTPAPNTAWIDAKVCVADPMTSDRFPSMPWRIPSPAFVPAS